MIAYLAPMIAPAGEFVALVLGADSTASILPVGGALTLLLGLGAYLIREVNRGSRGAWRVVREKNKEIHRLRWERDFWMSRSLGDPPPGPYVPPKDDEL